MRRILLQEVPSIDLHLRLVRPCPAEFERSPPNDRPGISYDEKFWNRALSHCVSTVLDNGCNVRRLTVNGDLARPDQGGQTVLACSKGSTISRHFLLAQFAENGARQ